TRARPFVPQRGLGSARHSTTTPPAGWDSRHLREAGPRRRFRSHGRRGPRNARAPRAARLARNRERPGRRNPDRRPRREPPEADARVRGETARRVPPPTRPATTRQRHARPPARGIARADARTAAPSATGRARAEGGTTTTPPRNRSNRS